MVVDPAGQELDQEDEADHGQGQRGDLVRPRHEPPHDERRESEQRQ